ncbi:hypothetical protein D3C71_1552150 [compost metagenome]
MATAQGGVARKRQLATGREDAHAVVGIRVGGRQQKRGFGQVGPAGKGLHGLVAQAFAVEHHSQRVAAVRGLGEHIDLHEGACTHGKSLS